MNIANDEHRLANSDQVRLSFHYFYHNFANDLCLNLSQFPLQRQIFLKQLPVGNNLIEFRVFLGQLRRGLANIVEKLLVAKDSVRRQRQGFDHSIPIRIGQLLKHGLTLRFFHDPIFIISIHFLKFVKVLISN